jgi:hypothetical protein
MIYYAKLLVIYFIFLQFIPAVILEANQKCEDSLPINPDDCYNIKDLNSPSFCCYLYLSNNTSQSFCKSLVYTYNLPFPPKTFVFNKTEYQVSCEYTGLSIPDENYSKVGEKCGNYTNVIKKSTDCTYYSTENNTCCYYHSNVTQTTTCFGLGLYSSNIYKILPKPNVTVTCIGNYLKFGFLGQEIKYLILSLMFILIIYK